MLAPHSVAPSPLQNPSSSSEPPLNHGEVKPAPAAAPSFLRLLLLGALAATLWLGYLRLQAGVGPVTFSPFDLPILGWYLLGTLLVALALGLLSRPRAGLRHGLAITLALVPAAIVFALLLDSFAAYARWSLLLVFALCLGGWFMARRLQRITGARQLRAVLAAVLIAGSFVGLNEYLYVTPALWYAEETTETPAPHHLDDGEIEALLIAQPDRVELALSRLGPRELGPSAYFLGFAGYAEEKVFAEEVRFAARTMDRRFGSGQRTLFLLNDVRDRQSAPLASVSTLRRALTGLGAQMNREQDLLILSLSSHGSESAELAVRNGNVPLQLLQAEDLRAALDDAGIRWRVLIVSACYAGSFIDALATDYSAIITSAAADRTSFGCSNDRDLTYFGEAFYRDALPGAATLRAAFEDAVTLVTERERAIDVTPSLPVAHFGAEIEHKLHTMTQAQRLRRDAAQRLAQTGTAP